MHCWKSRGFILRNIFKNGNECMSYGRHFNEKYKVSEQYIHINTKALSTQNNPYHSHLKTLRIDEKEYKYFDLPSLGKSYSKLPFSIRILLECAVRNCGRFFIKDDDVKNILNWEETQHIAGGVEIPFKPVRVILEDLAGGSALIDVAAMRDAVQNLGGDPNRINPQCPTEIVVDHSIAVDYTRSPDALEKNQELEMKRNSERFKFLKWTADTFQNITIVPPGYGIVHQVNLEYLARVVVDDEDLLFPDSLVGTDSHATMINGMGILGWGVGGIEAISVVIGQTISMLLPQVIGCKITGKFNQYSSATDAVLTITNRLRQMQLVGKFVEFFGPGVTELDIADRATISNMAPEYGATVAYFAVDEATLTYLRQTGREEKQIRIIEEYLKKTRMLRNFSDPKEDPVFSEVVTLDLSTITASINGPKTPHDRVDIRDMPRDFHDSLTNKEGLKGFGLSMDQLNSSHSFVYEDCKYSLKHGSIVLAAITSCTNTSNPTSMLGAGLLARNAVERGLSVAPYIKTSVSPGSRVVTHYLEKSGVLPHMTVLGFSVVGYGCMTCIGNSGPLPERVVESIKRNNLICCGVLSGNRNFEGRINPHTRANYLTSPLLVIAYAIAGRIDIDFKKEPLGYGPDNSPVYLDDIWPARNQIEEIECKHVVASIFRRVYYSKENFNKKWSELEAPVGETYPWDESSTYIKRPPYFEDMTKDVPTVKEIVNARVLLNLGDFVTTDHISPAGIIPQQSPAGKYLSAQGVTPKEFNSYGSRRGNHEVMVRGTFANIRLVNKFLDKTGPKTIHLPSGDIMDVFDVAEQYKKEQTQLIVLAGKNYGSGSSRDWAAKGSHLLGIKAVIAESFERIHRSNLIGVGILPLQYSSGQTAKELGLTGKEKYTIKIQEDIYPRQVLTVDLDDGRNFQAVARFDTEAEVEYYRHGGILKYMVRQILN